MLSEPLFATPAWRAAVEAAEGHCQCHGACGRKHPDGQGACIARHDVAGARLYLTEDGRVYCKPCFDSIAGLARVLQSRVTAETNAEKFPQDALLAP
jgi:hypothetical protein